MIQGVGETAESLMHDNFAPVSHRVTQFSPKCSETDNTKRDKVYTLLLNSLSLY